MSTEQELLPCPFCGAQPEMFCIGPEDLPVKRTMVVRCPNCRVERRDATLKNTTDWLESVAIAQWNRRWTPEEHAK